LWIAEQLAALRVDDAAVVDYVAGLAAEVRKPLQRERATVCVCCVCVFVLCVCVLAFACLVRSLALDKALYH
jgi:hypothetical protein